MSDLDITIYQGSTYQMTLTITDSGGTAIDLTGYTFRGQIRKTFSDTTVQASFTCTLKTQSGGTLGQVDVVLSATDSAAIDVDAATNYSRKLTNMIYDIESEDGSGVVTRWLQGKATISPEVTK